MKYHDQVDTPNFELMHEVLDHIRMNPIEHDQRKFRDVANCGTTMCFAGWACTLAGGTWVRDTEYLLLEASEKSSYGASVVYGSGMRNTVHAESRAQRLLGINYGIMHKLFYECRDFNDLERAVKDLENEYREGDR